MSDSLTTTEHVPAQGVSSNAPQATGRKPPRKCPRWLRILLIVMAGLIIVPVVLIAIIIVVAWITKQPDPPLHESDEVTSFIRNRTVNDDDRRIFVTLYDSIASTHGAGTPASRATDEIWDSLGDGFWDDITASPQSPRLWIRICELAEQDMVRKTGKEWQTYDFAYPYPFGDSPRTEESYVIVRLRCLSEENKGLVVTDRYLRWAEEPCFEDDYEDAANRYDAMGKDIETLQGIVTDNEFVCAGGMGDDDSPYLMHIRDNPDEEPSLEDSEEFDHMTEEVFDAVPELDAIYLWPDMDWHIGVEGGGGIRSCVKWQYNGYHDTPRVPAQEACRLDKGAAPDFNYDYRPDDEEDMTSRTSRPPKLCIRRKTVSPSHTMEDDDGTKEEEH